MNAIKGLGISSPASTSSTQVVDPAKFTAAATKTFESLKLALTKSDFDAFKACFHSDIVASPEMAPMLQALYDAAPKGGQAQLMKMGVLQKGDMDHVFAEVSGAAPGTVVVFAPENEKLAAVFFGPLRF